MFDCKLSSRSVLGFALVLGFGGFSGVARADDAPTARAARLTFVQGTVTVDSSDNTGSEAAQRNLPLLAGVRVTTGDDGQAEIEFEDGSLVRLTPNSVLSLDTLAVEAGGDGGVFTTGLSLLHGLAYAELRATPEYRYTIDAGGDVLSPVENTTVRVDFDEAPAIFAVLDGTAHIERAGGQNAGREVRAGESLRGDAANPGLYSLTSEIVDESWDGWNEDRDQAAATEASSQTAVRDNYAGAQGYGWSDLDANGSWYDVPGQGPVWQPQVAAADAGFDPYGNGSWVYSGGNYLFASAYPWGWTPYRCGNWSYFNGFGWGWSPVVGCGGFGWGFGGGGRPVNIVYAPGGYRVPVVPRPRPGPVHPTVPARVSNGWQMPLDGGGRRERRINGVTVLAMEPVGGAGHSEGRVGSALRRDYPVDRATHMPVVGKTTTQPSVVHTSSGWRPAGSSPTNANGNSNSASRPVPVYRAPVVAPAGASSEIRRPGDTPRVQPPQQNPQGQVSPNLPRAVERRGYTPPAQGQQTQGQPSSVAPRHEEPRTFTPPPQMQRSAPSPPPAPRMAPPPSPPPAPAAAPAPAAPAHR